MKMNIVTKAKHWCKKCKKKVEMEIFEVVKGRNIIGLTKKCPNCGEFFLISLNLEAYKRAYRQKGGKHAYQENKSKKFHES